MADDLVHALDADDFILYNTTSGALYYDGDGSHASVQFANLTLVGVDPALAASNFFIV